VSRTIQALLRAVGLLAISDPIAMLSAQESASSADVVVDQAKAETEALRAVAPCQAIVGEMKSVAGENAISCGEKPTMRSAIACANDAYKRKRPFIICEGGSGMDSWFELGVAGRSDGSIVEFYFDSMGPQHRGVCARENVAVGKAGWPQCTRELTEQVNLGTGEPYHEASSLDENWPDSCRSRALAAKRFHFPPKPLAMTAYVTNPERWSVDCARFSLGFDVLIDASGKVVCARVGREVATVGLVEEIRRNLENWRFEQPMVYGVPVDARWGMHAWRCEP